MEVGDLVEKVKGYGSKEKDRNPFRGIVIRKYLEASDMKNRVQVMNFSDGHIETWVASLCVVLS